jgi:serine/threonine-protein kinase
MPVSEDPKSLVGAVLNQRFHLGRILGEGGLAIVYEGRSTDGSPSRAVKLLRDEFRQDEEVVTRFLGEAAVAERVRHPGIVRVYGAFTAEDGTPYIVEELLTGHTLSVPMNRGPMPIEEATRVVAEVLEALQAAHEASIVHRDLKPDNVFLEPHPSGEPRVRLLDFGISRVIEVAGGSARRTKTGILLGTPGYMSPEQVKDAKHADSRSDLFSAGILFYELISARRAYSGETAYERMMAVLFADPTPIEKAAPQFAHWGPFFARALAREPEARFQSANDMVAALKSVAASGRMPGNSFGGERTAVSPGAPGNSPGEPSSGAVPVVASKGHMVRLPLVVTVVVLALVLGLGLGLLLGWA